MEREDIRKLINKKLYNFYQKPYFKDENMNYAWIEGFKYAYELMKYYLPREENEKGAD